MENQIIARLRDRLGTARNANEMFRVFSKFNALFVRAKVFRYLKLFGMSELTLFLVRFAELFRSIKRNLSTL